MKSGAHFVLAFALTVAAASPPVKVTLKSSWEASPLLLEIIETVASENADAFFPFLDRVTDPAALSKTPLPEEAVHQYALQVAATNGFLSAPGALALVEMNLGLHTATPKLQAFYNAYPRERDPGCGSWVDWYGQAVCDVAQLTQLAGVDTIGSADTTFTRPKLLAFDHVYPPPARTLDTPPRTAILYASLDSANFRELHSYLYALADRPVHPVEYVFRPIPGPSTGSRNFLSGYGVALDLKKMDYLAVDDRQQSSGSAARENTPEEAVVVDPVMALIDSYPEPETPATEMTAAALAALGFQATQLIADSDDPLVTMGQLAQNFPKYMVPLSRKVVVNSSLQEEVHANQLKAQAGVNAFWVNGASLTEKDINPLGLLRFVRKERTVLTSLTALGLSRMEAIDLVAHPSGSSSESAAVMDNLFDASDRPEGGEVIVWWNDLEKDSRYAGWSANIQTLLRPLYPGQFHQIKLNMFNIVLVLDLSSPASLNMITGAVANVVSRSFPLRFGIVPITETEDGKKMAKLFYHGVKNYGRKRTMSFLTSVMNSITDGKLDWDAIRFAFSTELLLNDPQDAEAAKPVDFDAVLAEDSPETMVVAKGRSYTERLGATLAASSKGHSFVNGKHLDVDEGFWRGMQMEIAPQTQHLQEELYNGKITEETAQHISTYFYDQPTTSLRRNKYIFPETAVRIFNLPDTFRRTGFKDLPGSFVYPAETEMLPLTVYVVADLDSEGGLDLVKEALQSFDENSKMRLSFIHNPSTVELDPSVRPPKSWLLSHLVVKNLLSKATPAKLLQALEPGLVIQSDGTQTADELTSGADFSWDEYVRSVNGGRLVLRELELAPGQQIVIVNGRIVGPIASKDFSAADFRALETFELRKRAEPVIVALETIKPDLRELDRATSAALISACVSIVAALEAPEPGGGGIFDPPKRPRQRSYQLLDDRYSTFQFGDNATALYQIAVLVDPISETAQKWAGLLEWLAHIPDVYIKVYTNPSINEEIPLKRFYRYALLPSLVFDSDGVQMPTEAVFSELPVEPIYTLAMDVPSSWLVRPREALYDLDNIQLGSVSEPSVDADFALDYLVVEGHARDSVTGAPPRGVQLQLLNADSSPVDDTQVVANLGYLQFKAKPGVFRLEIREQGRGREIFFMESVGNEGLDSRAVSEAGDEIAVTSFEGTTIYPRLQRYPGKEREDVLDEPSNEGDRSGSIFGGLFKSIFSSKDVVPVTKQADINIFTVASGLLYERFVSIMILSVLRNTKSTVKFWFIENFLSPSFLEFIPHMAEAYNFQYELVTYKWPSWLRAQKEKQRIIWAYKILFLDVLFPMDLKKVIFVDADQIVRADLKELVDLDLHGAPYGYTPMGDDNTDMEGFRFWKTGYWKDFLQGMPYHISALYVIDLVRFRQLAAGDMLRGSYQQLSADPGSLANLDQDLPNNLQREVPIFSLPEDWLWCETWCSKDRLHRAKTIDLCQNPLTKEPKLVRARQIPEWEVYDSEIARFASKLAEEGVIRSRIVAADANALAGSGKTSGADADTKVVAEEAEAPRDEL
ncbi:unnamed protein product [Mycena citricolor]|uniref:Glycosyltransferase family 24 protein n=1 Tax=Mycena citricolor TaxID=2018698 RepID=A0AAD2GSE6_9AGAR|nr:unnamed protein product [Mycena citricolor]